MVLGCIAAAKVLFHFLLTGRYGYFRDELYFLACSEHLAWGYVDHPPLSIAVLAVVRGTLGDSLFALRLLPVLAGALTIVLTGLIARELGARRWGQAMAASLYRPQSTRHVDLLLDEQPRASAVAACGLCLDSTDQDGQFQAMGGLWRDCWPRTAE
jgi:hypothetical protein